MSSSRPGRAVGAGVEAVERVRVGVREQRGRDRRVGALAAERLHDPAGAVGVVERERALVAGADDGDVLPALGRCADDGAEVEQAADQHLVAALGRGDDRPRAVRRREDQRLRLRLEELPRRGAGVEAVDPDGVALAADDAVGELGAQRPRLLDLGHAEHPPIAGRERLRDRRGGADDVDDDPGRGRSGLVRSERDMNLHLARLDRDGRAPKVLPAPRPRDGRLVLRVRARHLPGLHDVRAGRDPLPRPFRPGARCGEGRPERPAPLGEPAGHRHDDA